MPDKITFKAMNIVNQLFDEAEVPVKKRQEINDKCTDFVKTFFDGCRVCGEKTKTVFNIDFEAAKICEDCASSIFIQQAEFYHKHSSK